MPQGLASPLGVAGREHGRPSVDELDQVAAVENSAPVVMHGKVARRGAARPATSRVPCGKTAFAVGSIGCKQLLTGVGRF